MINKVRKVGNFIGGSEVAKNSLNVSNGDLISIKSGFADKSVVGDLVIGVSVETKTFDSDNQTVAKEKLEYMSLDKYGQVDVDVSGGTIAQANIGSIYNLTSGGIVDGATSATGIQMKLEKVLSTTRGRFSAVQFKTLIHTHDDRYFTETESDARFAPHA